MLTKKFKNENGFTLFELVLVVGLSTMIIASLVMVFLFFSKGITMAQSQMLVTHDLQAINLSLTADLSFNQNDDLISIAPASFVYKKQGKIDVTYSIVGDKFLRNGHTLNQLPAKLRLFYYDSVGGSTNFVEDVKRIDLDMTIEEPKENKEYHLLQSFAIF